MAHILTVEDDEDILSLIRYNLIKAGHEVSECTAGEEALKIITKKIPDLILLDVMLPGMDGMELCNYIKNDISVKHIPIIMLTAKGEEHDVIQGLSTGADDYIVKPFSPKILLARIQAVLRRKSSKIPDKDEIIKIHGISIHPGKHEVLVDGTNIVLTKTEFQILHFLARRPGWVFTRYQIVDGVKGEDYFVTDRAIDVTIVSLRKKLGSAAENIQTVRGIGYRFKE